ncbi:MAG: TetR/AcrR family transcriptional regulator [Sphingosinicella sp.]|nr:TetR/AcrR family transcriptional regulator [Sphingosinicella sp.]
MLQTAENRARRKNDPQGTRTNILDTAFELFQTRGYNGTSMQEIVAAAGVTAGAVHHHFATKKALGLEVIRQKVAASVEETWLQPLRSADSAPAAISAIIEGLARDMDARGSVRGCPLNNLTLELSFADPDFREELRHIFDDWRATLAKRLLEEAGRGISDAKDLAATVVATYSGAMALAKVEQSGEPLRIGARQLAILLRSR